MVFVGETVDPADYQTKAEPDGRHQGAAVLPGKVVYKRKAVVSPKAAAGRGGGEGEGVQADGVRREQLLPGPKTLTPEAKLKVLDGPAVAVEKEYADEVRKATR